MSRVVVPRSIAAPLAWVLLVASSGCVSNVPPPPDYSWVFDVLVTPQTTSCADSLDDADEATYTYGLVVEGDTVVIYSDDSRLAEGQLRGTYIAYASTAPFTENRTGPNGEPLDIEWGIMGNVSFTDQSLSASSEGEETITVFQSEVGDVDGGCEHVSATVWEKVR